MTPFQKLFWLLQMGISTFSDEKPQNHLKKHVQKSLGSLDDLDEEVRKEKNVLSKTAMNTMLGTGVKNARVMCILESPSAQEDKTGIYLSGEEGELTQKILASIDFKVFAPSSISLSPPSFISIRPYLPFLK